MKHECPAYAKRTQTRQSNPPPLVRSPHHSGDKTRSIALTPWQPGWICQVPLTYRGHRESSLQEDLARLVPLIPRTVTLHGTPHWPHTHWSLMRSWMWVFILFAFEVSRLFLVFVLMWLIGLFLFWTDLAWRFPINLRLATNFERPMQKLPTFQQSWEGCFLLHESKDFFH